MLDASMNVKCWGLVDRLEGTEELSGEVALRALRTGPVSVA